VCDEASGARSTSSIYPCQPAGVKSTGYMIGAGARRQRRPRRWQPTRPRRGAPGGGREPATRRNPPTKATENTDEPRARGDVWSICRDHDRDAREGPSYVKYRPRRRDGDGDGDGDDPGLCAPMRAHTDIAGAETAASIVQASFWFDK
jgi:hypothetical protein